MAKKIGSVVEKPKVVAKDVAGKVMLDGAGRTNAAGKFNTGVLPDFDPRKNLPMGKTNFTDTASFMEFRQMLIARQAQRLTEVVAKIAEKIVFLRKYGDDEARKKAMKMASLREQLRKLEEEEAKTGAQLTPQ